MNIFIESFIQSPSNVYAENLQYNTLQSIHCTKKKFCIKDFFSKCDQIRNLRKKSLMKNFIFCTMIIITNKLTFSAKIDL